METQIEDTNIEPEIIEDIDPITTTQKIKVDGIWVYGIPAIDEWYKQEVATGVWQEQRNVEKAIEPEELPPILITVDLSTYSCKIGEAIGYTITFSEAVTVPFIVPISVTDRNGNHVTNIGCTVTDGVATGEFTLEEAGDFTVTDEAINYHHTVITAPLKMTSEFWLRVYQ